MNGEPSYSRIVATRPFGERSLFGEQPPDAGFG
jgi:hypothetical protein